MLSASHFAYFRKPAAAAPRAASCPLCQLQFAPGRSTVVLACSHTVCEVCARQNVSGDVIRCTICQSFTPVSVLTGAQATPAPIAEDEEPPTNVFEVQLYTLAQESAIATGEPVYCKECRAVLNSYSQVEKRGEVMI